MGKPHYDVIVLGLGAIGSAVLYTLAQRGLRVCGVEQHGTPNEFGSSHGTLRAIRKAYFEHPDYIPLVNRAYELWEELDARASETLLIKNGLVTSGRPGSEVMRGLDSCYAEHDLAHENLSSVEAKQRFPNFSFPEDHRVIFDPFGGCLFVENCVARYIELAEASGADVRIHRPAASWKVDSKSVSVDLGNEQFEASALVLCLGPWMKDVLNEVGVELTVKRKVQLWYDSPRIESYSAPDFPCFSIDLDDGFYYGFPAVDERGIKVAEHSGGRTVDDPSALERGLDADDEAGILPFLNLTLPGLEPIRTQFSVCMYTNTRDDNFILDVHPEHPRVVIGCGFSGHGFKFAPVVGEILADLAIDGRTDHPAGFLELGRFLD